MSALTTGAIIGLAAASAGASVASAAIQSHGANEAAKTQADAAKAVQAYQAANTDKALAYISGARQQPTVVAAPMIYGQGLPSAGVANPAAQQAPPIQPPTLAQLGATAPTYGLTPIGQARTGNAVSPSTVKMRGPDGSLADVPPERVDFMKAKGAVLA